MLKDGDIRIKFDPESPSYSAVGKKCKDMPETEATMNLNDVHPSNTDLSTREKYTILHEFGHVLGLEHEHQSPMRPLQISIGINGNKPVHTRN